MTDNKMDPKKKDRLWLGDENFHSMFTRHHASMLIIEPDSGRILDANPAAEKFYGYPLDRLRVMNITDINSLPPDEVALERQRALHEHRNYFVFPHRLANGETRTVEVESSPITLGDQPLLFSIIHDVNDRMQAEAALRASEDKFKYFFENSMIGMSLTIPAGGINTNKAFCDMLGYTRVEFQSKTWQALTHPADIELTQGNINELVSGKKDSLRFEKRFMHKDGSVVWVDLSSSIRRDADGKPLYLMTSVNDISERKRSEDALRESALQHATILETAVDGFWLVDPSTQRIVEVNDAYSRMSGYSRRELLEMTIAQLEAVERAEDVDAHTQRIRELNADRFETVHRRRDGSTFPVDVSVQYLSQTGKMFVFLRDITERKRIELDLRESEARYQLFFENSGTANTIFDTGCRAVLQNTLSKKLTGPGDALGKTALEIFGPEQGRVVTERMQRVMGSGVVEVFETEFSMPVGHRWIRSSYHPLFNEQHVAVGVQVISQDITGRKQAEEAVRQLNITLEKRVEERTRELREAQEQLVRHEKLAVLGQMASSVGHELRNPLSVINSAIYYLKMIQPDADEKIKTYLDIIGQEVRTSEKIITDLLDFARVKSADGEVVAVSKLIRQTLERFPVPPAVNVTLNIPEDLPLLFVDVHQLTQVLGNLTVNACQSMASASPAPGAQNGGNLTLYSLVENDMIRITVSDTGVGIPPENIAKIFEPLFTTKPKGIGLGLAVSRKLVLANGGRIEVESEAGRGSSFSVYLPIYKAVPVRDEESK